MTRREIREEVFKGLFRAEFHEKEELPMQLQLSMDELKEPKEQALPPTAEEAAYIEQKMADIFEKLDVLDEAINEKAEKWKTSRMAKAELTILRLAVYEMRFEEEIPVSVAINEAVELAKTYGDKQGSAFVNGILAKLA